MHQVKSGIQLVLCIFSAATMFGCESPDSPQSPTAQADAGQEVRAADSSGDAASALQEAEPSASGQTEAKPDSNSAPKVDGETPKSAQSDPATTGGNPEAKATGFDVSVAGGGVTFSAPASWKKSEVKARRFGPEFEISVPKSEGEAKDDPNGRLTIMGAGGSVEANVQRWYQQYTQPDGGQTADVAKVTQTKVADCEVTWVDLTGTLMDKAGGPFSGGPTVERENYRMLAAIIQTKEFGQYFVKLYGPKKTIGDNKAAFKAFVESMTENADAKGL